MGNKMRAKVKFEVLTPIFIGSGEDYYPQDFFIDEDDRFYFIDREKFLKIIEKKGLFEKFLEVSGDINKLLGFIDDNFETSAAKDVVDIDSEVADELFESYSRPVKAFIKDRFYFKPYIPGSSLKGAIRTAILNYKLQQFQNDNTVRHIMQRVEDAACDNRRLNFLYKELETVVFCNENRDRQNRLQYDAKKDILKALFVEDLKPINYKLKVIKPKNRPYKKNKDNTIPVVLETLIDGEFEGEIRIDKNLLKDENLKNNRFFQSEPLNIDLIKNSLEHFYSKIIDIEKNRFRAKTPNYQEFLIKIGEHSGAGSKSLNGLRKIFIKQIRQCFDYQLSVWIDSEQNPLGWAKMELKE